MANQNPQSGPPRAGIRLEAIRQRRKRRRIQLGAALTVILAAALFYMTGLYGASIALLGDTMDTVSIALRPGPGWPQKTSMADVSQAEPLTGGFLVLGDTDLAVYSSQGNQLRRIQHGYARPAVSASGTRFCLYARTGTELRVESRTRTLYTQTFEQPILAASMAKDHTVGVLTRSARYTGELIVYNDQFSEIFHWYATESDGTPYLLDFSSNSSLAAVGCLAPTGGVMGMNVVILDTSRSSPLATVSLAGCRGYQLRWLTRDTFAVITDSFCAVFNQKGEEQARYSYAGRTLAGADVEGSNLALLFADDRLVLLNQKMTVLTDTAVSDAVSVVMGRKTAYCLTDQSVQAFSLEGEDKGSALFEQQPLTMVEAGKTMVLYGSEADQLRLVLPEETPSSSSGE